MMQQAASMMATFQQQGGQFAHPGAAPQMYFGAVQMPGSAQQPMQPLGTMPGMGPAMMIPGAQVPAAASAAPAPDGQAAAPDLGGQFQQCVESLSAVEQEYYAFLWEAAGCAGGRSLEGKEAVNFLSKSQLPRPMLKRIWEMADWQKRFCLGWPEFVVTMKLISVAQRNQPVSLERVLENRSAASRDCPEFQGVPNAGSFRAPSAPLHGAGAPAPGPAADPLGRDAPPSAGAAPEEPGLQLPGGGLRTEPLEATLAPGGAPPPGQAGGERPLPDIGADVLGDFGLAGTQAASEPRREVGGSPVGSDGSPMSGFAMCSAAGPPDQPKVSSLGGMPSADTGAWADFSAPGGGGPHGESSDAPAKGWADASALPAREPSSDGAWADFESAPAPDAAAPGPDVGAPLGSAGGPGSAAPPASSSPGGGLWSKMSAFDDLLREDDALGGSTAAAGLGEAFAAEAAQEQPPDLPVAAPAKADDDWGDFETADASTVAAPAVGPAGMGTAPAMGATLPSPAEAEGDDFGDFSHGGGGSGFADFDLAGPAGNSGGPIGAPASNVLADGAGGGGVRPAVEADAWTDFADSAVQSGAAPGAGPDPSGAVPDLFGETAPTVMVGESKADVFTANFDEEDFVTGSGEILMASGQSPAPSPQRAAAGQSPGPSPQRAAVDWADSPLQSGPVGDAKSSDVETLGWVGAGAGTQAGDVGGAGYTDWMAFDFDGPGPEPSPPAAGLAGAEAGAPGASPGTVAGTLAAPSPLASDSDGLIGGKGGGGKRAAVSPRALLPPPQAGGSPLAQAGPPAAWGAGDSSWAAFNAEDGFPPGAAASPAAPSKPAAEASRSAPSPPPPSAAALADPAVPQQPLGDADADGADGESFGLARRLAALGLFDEAEHCWAHAMTQSRLEVAEARKREAAAKDDFEGAIQSRDEIRALTAELASEQDAEHWRRLVAQGQRDTGLDAATERLRQRCQYLDDALSRAALCVAVGNFRCSWPTVRPVRDLGTLRSLAQQRRQAEQMSRSIEAVTSRSVLRYLQVLLVCLGSLGDLLQRCAEQLQHEALPEWPPEDRALALEAGEFQDFLRGLGGLRRVMWRLGLAAELFLPRSAAPGSGEDPASSVVSAGELPEADVARLGELQAGVRAGLEAARAAWARVEASLEELRLQLGPWRPGDFFELGGDAGTTAESHRSAPICGLCLLPTLRLGFEAHAVPEDGLASALFQGGLWHVQCANFWVAHGAASRALEDMGVTDPFAQSC
uniref:EH domain-containing protein n=1 Tax=Alexandrium monilatum TaxID=311494 RepID=A0A7S4UL68_9DINO